MPNERPISEEVLKAVGLNENTYQEAKNAQIEVVRQQGINLYHKFPSDETSFDLGAFDVGKVTFYRQGHGIEDRTGFVFFGELLLTHGDNELKAHIMSKIQTKQEVDELRPRIRALLMGFGEAAMLEGEFAVGIYALDTGSENGILENSYAMELVANFTRNNKDSRVLVAELMHETIERRKERNSMVKLPSNET